MRKFYFILLATLPFLFTVTNGCNQNEPANAELQQKQATNKLLNEMNRQIGLPNVHHFQQKKIMKMIYEQTDREDLICYAYLQSEYTGKLIFLGKCLGYGVPFSAQYTNPMKVVDYAAGYSATGYHFGTLPQADPNGLYMPTSSDATWLMLLDEKGKPHPVYVEPHIVVSPFPLTNLTK